MANWKSDALNQVMAARYDPNFTPRYRIPDRAWWRFWEPRWEWIEGISENDVRRAHGLEPKKTYVRIVAID